MKKNITKIAKGYTFQFKKKLTAKFNQNLFSVKFKKLNFVLTYERTPGLAGWDLQ